MKRENAQKNMHGAQFFVYFLGNGCSCGIIENVLFGFLSQYAKTF